MQRLFGLMGRLRGWAGGNRTRGLTVAATILVLIAATVGGWAYLASVALQSGQVTLHSALQSLDTGRYEEARTKVGQMLRSGRLPRSEYGGPLFVLGTVKTHDAENNATSARRRMDYLVASRYLKEARVYGFPPERHNEAMFILGVSLLESNQFDEGIEVLDELLASELPAEDPLALEAHQRLAETCLAMPDPQIERSLTHNAAVLANAKISAEDQADACLQRADALARLHRFDEARQTLASVAAEADRRGAVQMLLGRFAIDEVEADLAKLATNDRGGQLAAWKPKVDEAVDRLQQVAASDSQTDFIIRQAQYHLGRGRELQGDADAALRQFSETRQHYPESLEGMAASLSEADLLRERGDHDAALLGYRRVLESYRAANYRSYVFPRRTLRSHILAAVADFVERHRFEQATTIIDRFTPLFSRAEQLGIQGDTLQQWGNVLLSQADQADVPTDATRASGLNHLRAAGLAFEQLADRHFATRAYTDDLWKSAENYYRGHNFSRTIRQLKKYLANEPELRNAEALLRLGQAHLALGHVDESIRALEECIEFHPLNSSSYQARIDCAKAYWRRGDTQRAEQLLHENIIGSSLRPSSREWKDSLFELGVLLHEVGQHDDAIRTLEEAVARYPNDRQTLLAQYLIGESYRQSAQQLLERVRQARTTGERDKNRQLADAKLNSSLQHFQQVQRSITLHARDVHRDPLMGAMVRNCYMLEGSVLFDLGMYKEAIEAYSNVSSLYPDEPFVLETFVQIANCWRRLGRDDTARLAVKQAQIALDRLPAEAEFTAVTSFNREEWRMLLADMSRW